MHLFVVVLLEWGGRESVAGGGVTLGREERNLGGGESSGCSPGPALREVELDGKSSESVAGEWGRDAGKGDTN